MEYTLRPATNADEVWLDNLRREVYFALMVATFGAWDEERHHRHSRECWKKGSISIIESEGIPIGMLQVSEHPDALEVEEIQIQCRHQGKGLGTQLLLEVIEQAGSRNLDLILSVALKNERALRLYERLGLTRESANASHYTMRYRMRPTS